MARRRATSRRGGAPSARRSLWGSAFRIAGLLLVAVGFVGGFAAARYTVALDRTVRERFEGRLFRVPSRVLSAPTILYPGLDWKQIDLKKTLASLGYRVHAGKGAPPVGTYQWSGNRLRLNRRAFEHPSRGEPARDILITFSGSYVEEIRDAATHRELGAVFLEPELVGAYYGPQHEQRELVNVDEVPDSLISAVLAVEDQRFLTHSGIDVRRILGALLANLRAGGITQGGSTLTQQLVKNFFLTPERSYARKAQEALMALLLEARYDKRAILEAYLNEIYLGQRGSTAIHGVGEAARFYFGKPVRLLAPHESALIAAIIQSPNGLSPHRDPERALERRNLVLNLMHEQGRLDDAAYEEAIAQPLQVAAITPEPREARYFLDALRRQLPDFYGPETLTTEGLLIYSTLDLRLQRAAALAVREELDRIEKANPRLTARPGARVEACLVALRPQTGEVVALVGGRHYGVSQFDRCTQARRPAGSVFKPFVYTAALEPVNGVPDITLASHLSDEPLEVSTPSGPWRPQNFDHQSHGEVSVRTALENSYNQAAARLGQMVGIPRVAETAHRLGIDSALPEVPSLGIGAADVTPLELARAYATLANGGIRPHIRTFEDVVDPRLGAVDRQPIQFERVLDAGTAFLVTSLMEGVVDRGTARGIRAAGIQGPVAGKTGTSDDERDAWFAGFTPELVVVVWVGFDDPRSLGLPSSRVAVPVWARFMKEATNGKVRGSFLRPGDVAEVEIDPRSGALALAGCPERESEFFLRGTEPVDVCPSWAERPRPGAAPRPPGPPGWLEELFDAWFGNS